MSREKEPEPFLPGSERADRLLEEIRRLQSKSLSDVFGNKLSRIPPRSSLLNVVIEKRKIGRGRRWQPHGRIPQEQNQSKK